METDPRSAEGSVLLRKYLNVLRRDQVEAIPGIRAAADPAEAEFEPAAYIERELARLEQNGARQTRRRWFAVSLPGVGECTWRRYTGDDIWLVEGGQFTLLLNGKLFLRGMVIGVGSGDSGERYTRAALFLGDAGPSPIVDNSVTEAGCWTRPLSAGAGREFDRAMERRERAEARLGKVALALFMASE